MPGKPKTDFLCNTAYVKYNNTIALRKTIFIAIFNLSNNIIQDSFTVFNLKH